jgi:hypothetical protein
MNPDNSAGAVSTMMILNVLLAVFIAVTIFVLLSRTEQGSSTEIIPQPPSSAPAAPVVSANPSTPAPPSVQDTQKQIDALQKQLERENLRLKSLRVKEELIEAVREDSQLRTASDQEAQPIALRKTKSENAKPDSENKKTVRQDTLPPQIQKTLNSVPE